MEDVVAVVAMQDAVARRREDLRSTIRRLPGFEDTFLAVAPEAEPLLDDVAALVGRPAAGRARAATRRCPRSTTCSRTGACCASTWTGSPTPPTRSCALARPVVYDLFPVMTDARARSTTTCARC